MNGQSKAAAKRILNSLKKVFSDAGVILTYMIPTKFMIKGKENFHTEEIVKDLNNRGFKCEILN